MCQLGDASSGTTVDEIRHAPTARVNLVVNPIGLPLAQKMQEAFGTAYVLFDKYIDPDHIYELYQELFRYLNLPLPESVETLYAPGKDCHVGRFRSAERTALYLWQYPN